MLISVQPSYSLPGSIKVAGVASGREKVTPFAYIIRYRYMQVQLDNNHHKRGV